MKKIGNKLAILSPSFTLLAMVMLIIGKPFNSPWVWVEFGLILVCLGVMNVSYFSLYRDANAILKEPSSNEPQTQR